MDNPFNSSSSPPPDQDQIIDTTDLHNTQLNLSGSSGRETQFNYYADAQDFSDEIMNIKALLQGKTIQTDPNGHKHLVYPQDEKGNEIIYPFCSPAGQSMILAIVSTILQKGTVLSNYSIDTVLDRCFSDGITLAGTLYINMRIWKIDPSRYETLVMLIMDRIETARRRAVNNEERGFVGKAISVVESMFGRGPSRPPTLKSVRSL